MQGVFAVRMLDGFEHGAGDLSDFFRREILRLFGWVRADDPLRVFISGVNARGAEVIGDGFAAERLRDEADAAVDLDGIGERDHRGVGHLAEFVAQVFEPAHEVFVVRQELGEDEEGFLLGVRIGDPVKAAQDVIGHAGLDGVLAEFFSGREHFVDATWGRGRGMGGVGHGR